MSLDTRVKEFLLQCEDYLLLRRPKDYKKLTRELFRYLSLVVASSSNTLSPSPIVDSAWHALLLDPLLYLEVCIDIRTRREKLKGNGDSNLISHNPLGKFDSLHVKRQRYITTLKAYKNMFFDEAPSKFWPENYAAVSSSSSSSSSYISNRGIKRIRDEEEEEEEEEEGGEGESTTDTVRRRLRMDTAESSSETLSSEVVEDKQEKSCITVRVNSTSCGDMDFIVLPDQKVMRLRRAFAQKMDHNPSDYRLFFDGKLLRDYDTFESLGLKDNDVIDALLGQSGC
jgi:hypothetical protein